MSKTVAVIDLGTNTFNLLIAEIQSSKINFLHTSKIATRLGKDGINEGQITEEAFQRGIEALKQLKNEADTFSSKKIIAIATSMLREAKNAKAFVKEVKAQTGIKIQVVNGDEEAELIWQGVRHAIQFDRPKLIMDIGGGSTEFIIADQTKIYWQKSYPLGVTRLFEKFKHSDPIESSELMSIRAYIRKEIEDLVYAVRRYEVFQLIGSAGSFESYVNILNHKHNNCDFDFSKSKAPIPLKEFNALADWFYASNLQQRSELAGLVELRRNLIVIASAFIQLVVEECQIMQMELSTYALKEGVVFKNYLS